VEILGGESRFEIISTAFESGRSELGLTGRLEGMIDVDPDGDGKIVKEEIEFRFDRVVGSSPGGIDITRTIPASAFNPKQRTLDINVPAGTIGLTLQRVTDDLALSPPTTILLGTQSLDGGTPKQAYFDPAKFLTNSIDPDAASLSGTVFVTVTDEDGERDTVLELSDAPTSLRREDLKPDPDPDLTRSGTAFWFDESNRLVSGIIDVRTALIFDINGDGFTDEIFERLPIAIEGRIVTEPFASIPEPTTLAVMAGVGSLVLLRRRRA
jgi:hypothetical protein